MSTVASNTSLLCSVAEFLKRNDERTIGQLCSVTTTPVASGSLASDPHVLAALGDASGLVESAALRGEKYSGADLALVRDSASMAANLLFRIVSDLAWAFLWENRQNKALNVPPPPSMERSLQWLNDLADGIRIFPIVENMKAGHMDIAEVTPSEVCHRNGVVVQADRYFGERSERNERMGW